MVAFLLYKNPFKKNYFLPISGQQYIMLVRKTVPAASNCQGSLRCVMVVSTCPCHVLLMPFLVLNFAYTDYKLDLLDCIGMDS